MSYLNLISLAGLVGFIGIAALFSKARRRIQLITILSGVGLQFVFALFIFQVPLGAKLFAWLNNVVVHIIDAGLAGGRFLFGPLSAGPGQEGSIGFILAFQAFPAIIFFSAFMSILYYYRILPQIIRGFAFVFRKFMKLTGVESLCAGSNIFVGIESLTTIRPYLKMATASELCAILTVGMATIASSMLAYYVIVLQAQIPSIAGHLISASLLSAPAALVMAKVLMPETEERQADKELHLAIEREQSVFEAIINGATAGGKLVFGIVVLLIAVLGLVALLNLGLEAITGYSIQDLLGYLFYPAALMIGVVPADAMDVARLLGERLILTEVTAYQDLAAMIQDGAFASKRSEVLAAYALCGFAHVASMAIFSGGLAALVPERTALIAKLAFRALAAATLACLMTAAVAGIFYRDGVSFMG